MSNYSEEFIIEQTKKLRELYKDLPPFVSEFIRGIENQTSVLTRINYVRDLKLFLDYIVEHVLYFKDKTYNDMVIYDFNHITVTDIEKYLEHLTYYVDKNGKVVNNSVSGKSRKLATLRSFYKYFIRKQKLETNPAIIVAMPKLHEKPIIRLDANEVADLLDNVETGDKLSKRQKKVRNETISKRDLAIVTLFLSTGIRISELVGIDIDDIDFDKNAFIVTRKGGNKEVLYFGDEARIALLDYLNERKELKAVYEKDKNALFLSTQKTRLGVRSIQNLVKKYAKSTTLKNISPHKLRSTFGTMLYNETGDIYLVADVLGHKDVNTTKKHYAAQQEARKYFASKQIKLREDENE